MKYDEWWLRVFIRVFWMGAYPVDKILIERSAKIRTRDQQVFRSTFLEVAWQNVNDATVRHLLTRKALIRHKLLLSEFPLLCRITHMLAANILFISHLRFLLLFFAVSLSSLPLYLFLSFYPLSLSFSSCLSLFSMPHCYYFLSLFLSASLSSSRARSCRRSHFRIISVIITASSRDLIHSARELSPDRIKFEHISHLMSTFFLLLLFAWNDHQLY